MLMAVVPGESIMAFTTVKPSSFGVWCLLCEVKKDYLDDVYLDLEKAEQAGIHSSAYYHSFTELEKEGWIKFSRKFDGKKWWRLVKGFVQNSANVEFPAEAPSENSANVEKEKKNSTNAEKTPENYSANAEFSANVEFSNGQNSANVENPPRTPQKESLNYKTPSEEEKKPPLTPPKTRIPLNFSVTEEMRQWAMKNVPALDVDAATEEFYEYWVNLEGKKAERVDWFLTWKKGMRLKLKWQKEENGANRNNNGYRKQTNAEIYASYGYYD